MRVLLLGGAGQIGHEVASRLRGEDLFAPTREELDLADGDAVRRAVAEYAPEIIVNSAAYAAVDKAESERDEAHRLNAELPRVLAEDAAKSGALLLHYSSDYVYSGEKRSPYVEDDATGPLNEYGRSKLRGDEAVLASGARAVILRTSWVYSARRANFVRTMLKLGAERDELRVVDDQRGCPTSARMIAEATLRVLRAGWSGGAEVFHVAGQGEAMWFEFASEIAAKAKCGGLQWKAKLVPITTAEYPTAALRPEYSVLSCAKYQRRFGALENWKVSLREVMEEICRVR